MVSVTVCQPYFCVGFAGKVNPRFPLFLGYWGFICWWLVYRVVRGSSGMMVLLFVFSFFGGCFW